MTYKWDRIVGSIVWARARSSMLFGLPVEELMNIGRTSAMLAERSWRSDGGRTLPNWIYLQVELAVRKALIAAGRYAAEEDLPESDDEIDDVEARFLVREALTYLQANLPQEDWALLWLHHVEGWNCKELSGKWGITHGSMRNRLCRVRHQAVTLLREAA